MTTLTIHVTPADQAADPYFYVPVEVPEGTTRIDARLAYGKAADCVIDLGCLDPRAGHGPAREGFRGWSGGARDGFFVATDDATPGYVHGPIPPGRWQVILGLYKLVASSADYDQMETDFRAGGFGYGDFKKRLFGAVWEYFTPMRQRRAEILADAGFVDTVLRDSAEKANSIANGVMARVRKAVGL